jgi:hypothetical protein
MTQREIAKNNMYKTVLIFLAGAAASFAGFVRLLTEITNFTNLNGMLDKLIETQGEVLTGIAVDKDAELNTLMSITVKAARKGLVYANDQEDNKLAATFDVRVTDLTHLTETAAVQRIQAIYTALNNNAAALAAGYNVQEEDITAIADGISTFTGEQQEPGAAIGNRKAAHINMLKIMKQIDTSLTTLDDLIESEYEDTNDDLYEEYLAAREINNDGIRHSGIKATMLDSGTGAGVQGGIFAIAELKKSVVSDINGLAAMIKVTAGTYYATFSATGYVTQTIKVTIERGKIATMTVNMVAG